MLWSPHLQSGTVIPNWGRVPLSRESAGMGAGEGRQGARFKPHPPSRRKEVCPAPQMRGKEGGGCRCRTGVELWPPWHLEEELQSRTPGRWGCREGCRVPAGTPERRGRGSLTHRLLK